MAFSILVVTGRDSDLAIFSWRGRGRVRDAPWPIRGWGEAPCLFIPTHQHSDLASDAFPMRLSLPGLP